MSDVDFLVGEIVGEVRFGPAVRIVFDAGDQAEPSLYADVGRYTIFRRSGAAHEQDEARPAELGPTLTLVGKKVEAASTAGAVLELTFNDGSRLRCEPSHEFEAWQVVGGKPWSVVFCTTDAEVDAFD